jgi:glycosyltransferase 2 family protein
MAQHDTAPRDHDSDDAGAQAPRRGFPLSSRTLGARGRLLAAGLSIVLIAALVVTADPAAVARELDGDAIWVVALVCALYLGNTVLKAVRWLILLRAAGVRARWWEAYRAFLVGMAVNNLLPTGVAGEPVRVLHLQGRITAPAAGATTADRLLDAVVIMAIALVGIPLLAGVEPGAVLPVGLGIAGFTAALTVLVVLVWRRWRLQWLLARPDRSGLAAGLTLPIQLNDGWRLLLLAEIYGVHLGLWKALAVVALATVAGLVAVLGGGAGLAITTGALLGALGVPAPDAAAISLLFVATSTWLSFPLGAAAALAPATRTSGEVSAQWT